MKKISINKIREKISTNNCKIIVISLVGGERIELVCSVTLSQPGFESHHPHNWQDLALQSLLLGDKDMEWLEESSLQMGLDTPSTLMLTFYYHDPDNEVAYLRPSKVGIDLSPNQKKWENCWGQPMATKHKYIKK